MKQRLIGAAVLVALAVLVLPVFFDGAGLQQAPTVEFTIPPRPEFEPAEPLEPARLPPPVAVPAEPQAVAEDAEAEAEAETARTEPVTITPPQQPGQSPAGAPEPADELVAWVVQLGSFARESNALGLRDKLREAGFDAFIRRAESGGAPSYRVRIGPVQRKADAGQLLRQLKAAGHQGIVLQHR